jgi:hypothetical protein
MKRTLVPIVLITILLQGLYILKLRQDLDTRRKINEQTVMDVLNRTSSYATYEAPEQGDPLPEPDCLNDNSNVVERIEMLEMHLDYNPSRKWIRDVLLHAKEKLK